ncbi:aspartate kinase [Algoriphagus namhaensis]|uniref:Aspartokinase n=1 Tax=Algoriphagus namhaensis TaxID=915353 RepID=A0ABV8AQB5_9BACT
MAKTLVYKFGGASVKDADAVKNLADILRNRLRKNPIIVVSAMGKTTNALEEILLHKFEGKDYSRNITILESFHLEICSKLFEEGHAVYAQVKNLIRQLEQELTKELNRENYDCFYDQVIGFGELLSSRIVMEYLCEQGSPVVWQDAREIIRTNSEFRFAKIDWELTKKNAQTYLVPLLDRFPVLTQGFIGADPQNRMTTLGREGSDFSAAILGVSLNAASVTIWKDVPGVLNADPKIFPNATLFEELDYKQAAEMTFYGASVIHPKTIKPLANAGIPLFVRSFVEPEAAGTKIHGLAQHHSIPTYVLKRNQILVSFAVKDFTFIEEKHIHQVYEVLQRLKLKVNMLQTAAISISIVIDSELFKLEQLITALKPFFEVRFNEDLELLTVLNVQEIDSELLEEYELYLEQQTRNTFQAVRKKRAE